MPIKPINPPHRPPSSPMAKKPQIAPDDQIRPFAAPSPSLESQFPANRCLQTHRFAVRFCGVCGAAAVLLGLIVLILAFTVLKVKDPQLTMNSVRVDRLLVPGPGASLADPVSFNATLTADISIENPNAASFRFRSSTTDFYYGGAVVGVGYAPEGEVRPRRTLRVNVTVEVLADKVVAETDAPAAAFRDGAVNLTSFTDVSGKVNLLGIYKRDLDILLNCSFTLRVFDKRFVNRVCEANVM